MSEKIDKTAIELMKAYLKSNDKLDKATISINLLSELNVFVIDSLLLDLQNNSKNTDVLSNVYNLMSKKEFILNNFKESLNYLDKAIELSDRKDEKYVSMLYMNKARNYNKMGECKLAKEWQDKALMLDSELKKREPMIVNEIERNSQR